MLRPLAQDDPESDRPHSVSHRPGGDRRIATAGDRRSGPGRAARRGHLGSEHHPDRQPQPGARPSGARAGVLPQRRGQPGAAQLRACAGRGGPAACGRRQHRGASCRRSGRGGVGTCISVWRWRRTANVGATSDERIIYVFGLPFERDAESLKKSGVGISVWGGCEYQYPLAGAAVAPRRVRRLAAGIRGPSLRHGFRWRAISAPRWLTSANTEVSLLASARQDWIRTAPDHRDVGARIEMGHRLTPRVAVNGRASWHRREYRTRVTLDGPVLDVSLGGSWVITPTVRAEASVGSTGESARTAEMQRNANRRAGVSVSVVLPQGFNVGAGGELRWTAYQSRLVPVYDGRLVISVDDLQRPPTTLHRNVDGPAESGRIS